MATSSGQSSVWGRQKEAWKAKSRAAIVEFIEHFAGRLQCTATAFDDGKDEIKGELDVNIYSENMIVSVHRLLDLLADLRTAIIQAPLPADASHAADTIMGPASPIEAESGHEGRAMVQ